MTIHMKNPAAGINTFSAMYPTKSKIPIAPFNVGNVKPESSPRDKDSGIAHKKATIQTKMVAVLLFIPLLSMSQDTGHSMSEVALVMAAKSTRKKKTIAQIIPPGIELNTVGRVWKIRLGPAPTSTLNAAHAGKIAKPASKAAPESIIGIIVEVFSILVASGRYEP